MKLKQFIQQETVLTAAAVLAVVSAFFVPPDAQYLGYIDLRTLAILFSLMTVMAGLRRQGFFDGLGRALLSRTHSTFQLTLVLVGLCFFGSMFITNDVSLLTFVPFTFVVLSRLGTDVRCSLLIPVVCMQTIAANLGSMLTPIGNPQNLYFYGKSGMNIGGFVLLILPYTLVSLLLLLAWAALVCRKASAALSVDELVSSSASQGDQRIILLYLVLFAVCLLSVIRVLPYGIAFAAVLVCALFADPRTLRAVDYSLLLTFVAFFIFIGNLGRIPAFSGWLQEFLTGREVLVAVLASQVTSNVPAALLLSGFTAETQALIIGTNLGGLGTLIASMASLISYRQIARELPQGKKQYFGLFTLSNLIFLALLLGVWFLLRCAWQMTYGFSIKLKKGALSRTKVRAELPLVLLYNALFAFRLLADIHPALGSGGCFQLLQGQLDGGVAVARRRVDGVELAQALVQIDRHTLVHPKGAHTAGGMTHVGLHLIFQLSNSYSVMAQTRAGRPVAPSMRG